MHDIDCLSLQVGCQDESGSNAADLIGYQGLHTCAEEIFGNELDAMVHHSLHLFHLHIHCQALAKTPKLLVK